MHTARPDRPARPSLRQFMARRRRSAAPTPVRVRRLVDSEWVVGAYGLGALAACPIEIVDLSDGTRVCEWTETTTVAVRPHPSMLDEDSELEQLFASEFGVDLVRSRHRVGVVEVPLRVRYASEEDMWRGLHVRAVAKSDHRRFLPGVASAPTIAAWAPVHVRAVQPVESPEWKWPGCSCDKAILATRAEDAVGVWPGFADGGPLHSARTAYVDRPGALPSVVLSWDPTDAAVLRVTHVEVPGAADDRPRDSLGRPNTGAKKGMLGVRKSAHAPRP